MPTILRAGGTSQSVLIGSYERSKEFYELSDFYGAPDGGELVRFNVGEKTIEAIILLRWRNMELVNTLDF